MRAGSVLDASSDPDRGRTVPTAEEQILDAHIGAISRSRLPVLLLGETGTGKSYLARQLHEHAFPGLPFIDVNVAALTGTLFCSEMFGHERGAFTGAVAAKPGLIAAAEGGTLFLDELADLGLESQAHLLSFLDSGTYRAVGSVRERTANVRVFAATNRNLQEAVAAGTFRRDLYYRLAGFVLPVPPLRDRRDEVPGLIWRLTRAVIGDSELEPPRLAPEVIALLTAYPWPGNVRQLRFIVERIVAGWPGRSPTPVEVSQLLGERPMLEPRAGLDPAEVRPLEEVERVMVRRALEASRGNRTIAARMLGITTRGLYNKLRRHASYYADVI